jgi:hypothetical protein
MGRSAFSGVVSCVLAILFPLSLLAADSNAAMLYTNGSAWINGAHVPRSSSAIFFGDLLQTRSDSIAKINQPGSTITVLSDSLVKFQGDSLDIEHGAVMISTSHSVSTTAGNVKVTPANNNWTEFNVTDVDGTVHIAAHKGDLTIRDGKDIYTLAQGQETSRDDSSSSDDENAGKKKNRKHPSGAVPAAGGGALNSPIAVGIGGAAAVGILLWAVPFHNDDPASPSKP